MLMSIHGQLIENDPYTKKPHDKSPFENETSPQIKKWTIWRTNSTWNG